MQYLSIIPLILAAPFFSTQYLDKADALKEFPQPVGATMEYRHTYETDLGPDMKRVKVTWTECITVQEHVALDEGTLILRGATISNTQYSFPPDLSDAEKETIRSTYPAPSPQHLLILGNYIYEIDDSVLDSTKRLPHGFLDRAKTDLVPTYFFPMDGCKVWAERSREAADIEMERKWKAGEGDPPNPAMYYWTVEGTESVKVPFGRVEDAYLIRYRTIGGYDARWVKPGLGLVRQETQHQGTYINSTRELVSVTTK